MAENYIEALTFNAQEWARYFEREGESFDPRERLSLALKQVKAQATEYLRLELEKAIESSPAEYDYGDLFSRLVGLLNNPEIVFVDEFTESIYYDIESVAGGLPEFEEGIRYARGMIEAASTSDKVLSPAQKAAFWRLFIYGPGREGTTPPGDRETEHLYAETIEMRLEGWGELAPYWYWLEHGNQEYTLAYPKYGGTRFRRNAEIRATIALQSALRDIDTQATNLLEDAASDFIRNPDTYRQFDVLRDFYAEGRRYLVYVTKTRRVGVALSETYRQLKGE